MMQGDKHSQLDHWCVSHLMIQDATVFNVVLQYWMLKFNVDDNERPQTECSDWITSNYGYFI
jgi:hypothetical protein